MGRNLAESDKGSFYQQEKWLEELDIQKSENVAVAESASRSKIQLEEPDEESQLSSSTPSADGTWKTISGRAIVSSEKLLEKLDESVACRFCQARVQVMENVATKHGLGSTWRIQCENESRPSAWRRSTKTPGGIIPKRSKERQNFCSRKN